MLIALVSEELDPAKYPVTLTIVLDPVIVNFFE